MPNKLPSVDYLHKALLYDPDTGLLTWRKRPLEHFENHPQGALKAWFNWNHRHAGKPAFRCLPQSGTVYHGTLDGFRFPAARIAYTLAHGRLRDTDVVYHRNRNGLDNSSSNLALRVRTKRITG